MFQAFCVSLQDRCRWIVNVAGPDHVKPALYIILMQFGISRPGVNPDELGIVLEAGPLAGPFEQFGADLKALVPSIYYEARHVDCSLRLFFFVPQASIGVWPAGDSRDDSRACTEAILDNPGPALAQPSPDPGVALPSVRPGRCPLVGIHASKPFGCFVYQAHDGRKVSSGGKTDVKHPRPFLVVVGDA
jgi:hypothetical protein